MTEAALDNFIESTKRTVMNTFPLSDMKDEALHDAIEDLVAENLLISFSPPPFVACLFGSLVQQGSR